MVDDLERQGHVELRPNPAHRRSPLVALTDGDPMISARLARALADLGRVSQALEILEHAREKHPYAAILESVKEQIRKDAAKSASG